MIDYKTYDKLNELLAEGDLQKIQQYIDKEKNKYYLYYARKALTDYLYRKQGSYSMELSYYEYVNDKLLITDRYTGGFLLDNDEILSSDRKKHINKNLLHAYSLKFLNILDIMEKDCTHEVFDIQNSFFDKKQIIMLAKNQEGEYAFNKKLFEITEHIMGENPVYMLNDNDKKPLCLVKSSKGAGIICGIAKKD